MGWSHAKKNFFSYSSEIQDVRQPYWKNILKLFISETTEPFDSKIGWNVPWLVLYQMSVFFVSFGNP